MIASFTGLLLTVSLAGDIKEQKQQSSKKMIFTVYTSCPFCLKTLLKYLFSQANLSVQRHFSTNVVSFWCVRKILESFDSQVNLMHELKEVDVAHQRNS
jgi:hypothetical protein